jgi:RNase H-like domain found in reverse transcriptase/Integrase zinc binding domain/Retrotransposon gag protein/Retroviral aspartyl protease/Reverse transcriptase (RNA-dependent DNA polymerase)/Chromo (CHRromatin Organisation MOdifier) domain/Zinc knuckle
MSYGTRSSDPEFLTTFAKELYSARRQFSAMTGFPFDDVMEEAAISALSDEQVTECLAKIKTDMEGYGKTSRRNKGRRKADETPNPDLDPANESPDPVEAGDDEHLDEEEHQTSSEHEEGHQTSSEHEGGQGTGHFSDPEPSDSDSSDSDPENGDKGHRSRRDKERVRGRTPRIKTSMKTSRKLFKMEPPAKYSGEKDSDRTYESVNQFLSQLSRYLRLSTNVDMKKDIAEYVLAFLDGFAFHWFDNLEKGKGAYKWEAFDRDIRAKFIPIEYSQMMLERYMKIRQGGRSLAEYLLERERLETSLGRLLNTQLKEMSFRRGLNEYMRDRMVSYRGMPFEEYKRKAEMVDQDARERKVGHYKPDTSSSKSNKPSDKPSANAKTSSSDSKKSDSKSANTTVEGKPGKKRDKPSHEDARKQGLCFYCGKKGHLSKECPDKASVEVNSIRVLELNRTELAKPSVDDSKPRKDWTAARRDGRRYSDVVSAKPATTEVSSNLPKENSRSPNPPKIPTISISKQFSKPPPLYGYIMVNGVKTKTLFDTGASDDFVSTQYVSINRVPVKQHGTPMAIQQAVQGSKPKSQAKASLTLEFGEWKKTLSAHTARLAGYDLMLGIPTLTDGDGIIYLDERKVHFRAWNAWVDCFLPETPPEQPRKVERWTKPRKRCEMTKEEAKRGKIDEKSVSPKKLTPLVATATKIKNSPSVPTQSYQPRRTHQSIDGTEVSKSGTPEYYRGLLMEEFTDVLVDELPPELPPLRDVNHRIPFKPSKPWAASKYRLAESQKKALEEDVAAKVKIGILVPSDDLPLAPSMMVPKKEKGTYRHVQDLRRRNADTETIVWPLPDQEEVVNAIAKSSNGSVFDMISAFNQIRIEPEDEKYATIINHMGVYRQRTMQMGDKNAVSTQQHSMQHHLREHWGKNVVVYVDDGTIYDERPNMSLYEHYSTVRKILLTLRKHKFFLARKKTHFFIDMKNEGIDVLGRHVQDGKISISKAKVDAFVSLRSPTSFQELGKDIGMFNWLTEHLPFAADLSSPLNQLYHSGRWEWTETHEIAFTKMKELVAGHEVLTPLDFAEGAEPVWVITDASLVGIGGWIAQGPTLETAKPAVYHSRVFNPAQSNYPTHEQELLALEDLLKSYEHWLLGRKFTVITDSQQMLSLLTQKSLSHRQMRTVIYLSQFDIEFRHIEGKKNIIADLLSRIAERATYRNDLPAVIESADNDDNPYETVLRAYAIQLRRGKVLLDEPQIKRRTKTPIGFQAPEALDESQGIGPTDESLNKAPDGDAPSAAPGVSTTLTRTTDRPSDELPSEGSPLADDLTAEPPITSISLSHHQRVIVDGYKEDSQFRQALNGGIESGIYEQTDKGLLYLTAGHRLCIPNVKIEGGKGKEKKNLREMLIQHAHVAAVGHRDIRATLEHLRREYYWKDMAKQARTYIRSCHSCQTKKNAPTKQYGYNHPLPIPGKPWTYISMDFMVNLPSSAIGNTKYNSLFVVVDSLSKMAHLIPTTTTVTAEGVAKLYFDNIFRLHGLPLGIISDRDSKFTGAFWKALQKMVGTDLMMSTASHPQTDGQTERMNRSVIEILRHFVNVNGSDWAQHLSAVEFAVNSSISRSTGKAPFEVVYGYLPRTFPPIVEDIDNPASMDFLEGRMLAQLAAQDSIIAAQTEQSYYVNQHRKDDPTDIKIGDLVVVSNESQLTQLPKGRRKLASKWVGPYKVLKLDKSKSNYTLEISGSRRHNTFHVNAIKRYFDPHLELFPNRQRRRPRIAPEDRDLNLEIEKIIGHRRLRNNVIRFLCKWEGYPNEDATYRDAEDFKTSEYGVKLVADYIVGFGELPDELGAWILRSGWIKEASPDTWRRVKGKASVPTRVSTGIVPSEEVDVGNRPISGQGLGEIT